MIDCPKCGFNQPKDVYCASCGVDMQSYQAKPIPMLKNIWSQSITQTILFFILVISLISIVYFGNLKNKIVSTFTNKPHVSSKMRSVRKKTNPVQTKESKKEVESNFLPITPEKPAPIALKDQVFKMPSKFKISYFEATLNLVNNTLSESIDDSIKVSKLNSEQNFNDFITQNSSQLHKLPGSSSHKLEANFTVYKEFKIIGSTEESLTGLYLEITAASISKTNIVFKISGQIKFPNSLNSSVNNFEFDTQIKISPKETGYVLNFILPEKLNEDFISKLENSPMIILESPDFIQNNSTIIMFITLEP